MEGSRKRVKTEQGCGDKLDVVYAETLVDTMEDGVEKEIVAAKLRRVKEEFDAVVKSAAQKKKRV